MLEDLKGVSIDLNSWNNIKAYADYGLCGVEGSICPGLCDTIDENDRKEDRNMSFVGMLLKKDEIIAFGDSKSTYTTVLGTMVEQPERGAICKVFANDRYVITTAGTNQFAIKEEGFLKTIFIENWLSENIPLHPDYTRLLEKLAEIMTGGRVTRNNPMQFLIGSFEEGHLFVQHAEVAEGSVFLGCRNINNELYTDGIPYYRGKAQEIMDAYRISGRGLKAIIEKYITDADGFGSYNPAGLPVNVITWRPEQ